MALIYTPKILSGSANGRNISITATATPGTIIHTAISGIGEVDEIFLEASAVSSSLTVIGLILELGGTDEVDRQYQEIDVGRGPIKILNGRRFDGGVVIRAYKLQAGILTIGGIVNNIAPEA